MWTAHVRIQLRTCSSNNLASWKGLELAPGEKNQARGVCNFGRQQRCMYA